MALHLKSTGIDFTDFSDHANMASEFMDDYEEGTFSVAHGTIYTTTAQYTKIGREVCPNGEIKSGNIGDSAHFDFSMPFTSAGQAGGFAAGYSGGYQQYIYLSMTNGNATVQCEAGTALTNLYFFYFSLPYYAT